MKSIILPGALLLLCAATSTQAQLLKKLKDKVNKAVGKDDGKNNPTSGADDGYAKMHWCDTITATGDGVSYTKAYSGSRNISIVYSECSMDLSNNSSGYRLILSHYVGGKTEFIVVENGKVIDTDTKVKREYLGNGLPSQHSRSGDNGDEEMKKYIIADSSKQNIPKTDARSMKTKTVTNDQMEMALNMMRQTDEYKNKSDAEKKEMKTP